MTGTQPTEAGPDTICVCGHWYEEHYLPADGEPGGCEGCHASSRGSDDAYEHGFEFDPESNTFEAIADRGGDPDKWPAWMKEVTP